MPAAPDRKDMLRPRQIKVQAVHVIGEIPKLMRLRPRHLAHLIRALAELANARSLLARKTVRELGIPDGNSDHGQLPPATAEQADTIAYVSKAIAIVAPRVPWRSDCLVQCLAGRRWLATKGIAARITIGVKQEQAPDGSTILLAHAWLKAGNTVVTGGDVSEFDAFVMPRKV